VVVVGLTVSDGADDVRGFQGSSMVVGCGVVGAVESALGSVVGGLVGWDKAKSGVRWSSFVISVVLTCILP